MIGFNTISKNICNYDRLCIAIEFIKYHPWYFALLIFILLNIGAFLMYELMQSASFTRDDTFNK